MKDREYRILFTSVGRRVELVQAFREAAKKENINLKIYAADMSDTAPALFFCDTARTICRISEDSYISQLLQICKEDHIDLLIPTIDTDLLKLSEAKEQFEKEGIQILISAYDKIAICRDKRNTYEFFKKCGLFAPETFDNWETYHRGFPCFIKPKDGSSSINAYRADSREELKEIAKRVPDYIVQPYIDGVEYTVDIFCDFCGNPIFITPRIRIAVRSGEVLQTCIVEDDSIIQECKTIIEHFKPCGPITVQLIKDRHTGDNYYIEINPRYGGGAPLSMKAGADSARSILLLLSGVKTGYQEQAAKAGRMYSRFDQSIAVYGIGDRLVEIDKLVSVEPLAADKAAVVFDLDDTLYNESDYVRSGFLAVAKFLTGKLGNEKYSQEIIENSLYSFFEKGMPAINCLFEQYQWQDNELKSECITIYREHIPQIVLPEEHRQLLIRLKTSGKKIGIVTDGRVCGQENKIKALGLEALIDEYVITDALAGNADEKLFRKPNPLAFQILRERFGTSFEDMVYIGDNVQKDFQGPISLGMAAVWYRNPVGIYSGKQIRRTGQNE